MSVWKRPPAWERGGEKLGGQWIELCSGRQDSSGPYDRVCGLGFIHLDWKWSCDDVGRTDPPSGWAELQLLRGDVHHRWIRQVTTMSLSSVVQIRPREEFRRLQRHFVRIEY
ncbi:hypothetical protein NDN08_000727 [Rhodosorus marinus]|uniref:Uncharacterized protein n=1 Tax=Rhodosorus marinus TaxID=101924 RepID=A0AAV8UNT9_9RHOD|nr:hypothetical protein NDN08_000727 [Rhodosorus marinus]